MSPIGIAEQRPTVRFIKMSYMGPSMNPTLKAGDVLNVVPYQAGEIRVGDVVVFDSDEEDQKVVHRVVGLYPRGATTRGDNSLDLDDGPLQADRIIGRVVSKERANRETPVRGGKRGYLYAAVLQAAKHFNQVISRLLHPTYYRLARTGIFGRLLSPWIKPRVVCFKRPAGTEMQLYWGRWVIGRRYAGQHRWWIRRPFRLVVDEALLAEEFPSG